MDYINIFIGENYSYPNRIFTEICLNINGYDFPCEGWQDFSYDILCSWIYNLLEHVCTPRKTNLCFFDGDYSIRVAVDENEVLTLECMGDNKVVCVGKITMTEFLLEIRRAFRQLQQVLSENKGELSYTSWNDDINWNINRINQFMKK